MRNEPKDKETPQQVFEYLRDHPSGYQFDDEGDLWFFSWSEDGRQLLLTFRTLRDWRGQLPEYSIPAPPGWRLPFGLSY